MNGAVVISLEEKRGQFLVRYQEEECWFHPDHVGRGPVYILKAAARHVPTGITAAYEGVKTLGQPSPEHRSWTLTLCQRKAQEAVDALPQVEMDPAEFDPLDRETWGNFLEHQRSSHARK